MVLLFMAAASTIVISMASRASTQVRFLRMEQERMKARLACISGYQWAVNRLLTGSGTAVELLKRGGSPLSPRVFLDGTAVPLDLSRWHMDQRVSISLQDSAGLVNILTVPPAVLRGWLQRTANVSIEETAAAVDLLMDWMDPDDLRRISGGEADHYLAVHGEPPSNRMLDGVEELGMVRGLAPAVLSVLRESADFSIINQGVNLNASPPSVFRLFPGLTEDKIRSFVRLRRGKPFRTIREISEAFGYDFTPHESWLGFFTSRSVYVTITAELSKERVFFVKVRIDRGRTVRGVSEMRSSWLKMLPPEMPREIHLHRWQEGSIPVKHE